MEEQKELFSEFAIASLVLGILSFFQFLAMKKSIAAIVFGFLSLNRIKKNV